LINRKSFIKIGIDLDNTIISYDKAFQIGAKLKSLVPKDCSLNKKAIRDLIRKKKNGEIEWQKLQGYVYSKGIKDAVLFPGVFRFIWLCRQRKFDVEIVSHKTEYGHFNSQNDSIRDAATNFLINQGLLNNSKPLINKITYKNTKQEKIDYIKQNNFDWFIDDLEEIIFCKDLEAQKAILFSDENHIIENSKKLRAHNWEEISQILINNWTIEDVKNMVQIANNRQLKSVKKLEGRGNSAIYKLYFSNGQKEALKIYPTLSFHDRLKSEFEGTKIFQKVGIKNVQKPRFVNKNIGVASYEWIEGESLLKYGKKELKSALSFIKLLHHKSQTKLFKNFPLAADACLKGEDIEIQINRRLVQLDDATKKYSELNQFINHDFKPLLVEISSWSKNEWPLDEDFKISLNRDQLILSPSDFGFHNSIQSKSGELIFHDFEYLGWDNPVKLISDFSHHAAMNLSIQLEKIWFFGVSEIYGEDLLDRLRASWPLYGLNWCLIILNEFKDDVWNRRCAADERKLNQRELQLSNQLAKSKNKLDNLALNYKNKFYW
jgi:hypothetical protein